MLASRAIIKECEQSIFNFFIPSTFISWNPTKRNSFPIFVQNGLMDSYFVKCVILCDIAIV